MKRARLMFDIGSTYFKVAEGEHITQYFRDFGRPIHDDLHAKCGDRIARYAPEDIRICSSANGGLSTLIVGTSRNFSIRYATHIAWNSGINIIDTVLYRDIETAPVPGGVIDVVILVGGIDDAEAVFDRSLVEYLGRFRYQNIVHAGNDRERAFLEEHFPDLVTLPNILDAKLAMHEAPLRHYLTDLYQADIVGKEDIKELYAITANQIYSTPYIVNRSLVHIHRHLDVVDPFVLIDIGGATTDIHYSRDLVNDRMLSDTGYDRLVFKKLGVYKSRESLVFTARNNEYVYELLGHLNATEDILDEHSDTATRVLMQLAIFLVLYKVSHHHADYIELALERLNTLVFTGGITQVLSHEAVETVVTFFYHKILRFHQTPRILIDTEYAIWTYGMTPESIPPDKETP